MRILHLSKGYPPGAGGIETLVQVMARASVEAGHEVEVWAAADEHGEGEEWDGGVRIKRWPVLANWGGAPWIPQWAWALRGAPFDLLHVHWPHPPAVLAAWVGARRVPWVVTYHSDVVRQRIASVFFSPLLHGFLGQCAAVMISHPAMLKGSRILQRHTERCRVVPFGLPMGDSGLRDPEVERQCARLPGVKFLAVGRLVYYKGLEVLLNALARVPEASLILVGEGPLRADLEEQARVGGISERVLFAGRVREVGSWWREARALVLPSTHRSEAFGLVQLEAMREGLPVINTSLPTAVPHVSVHEETGLTVPPGDVEALAAALRRMSREPEACRRWGEQGQSRARDAFSVEGMMGALDGVMREVVCAGGWGREG